VSSSLSARAAATQRFLFSFFESVPEHFSFHRSTNISSRVLSLFSTNQMAAVWSLVFKFWKYFFAGVLVLVLESELFSSSSGAAGLTVVLLVFLGGLNLFGEVFLGSIFVVLLIESETFSWSVEEIVVLLVFLGSVNFFVTVFLGIVLVVLFVNPLRPELSELVEELDTVVLRVAFLVGRFIGGLFVAPKLFEFEVGLAWSVWVVVVVGRHRDDPLPPGELPDDDEEDRDEEPLQFEEVRLDPEPRAPFLAALTHATRNRRANTALSLIFSRTPPRSNCVGDLLRALSKTTEQSHIRARI